MDKEKCLNNVTRFPPPFPPLKTKGARAKGNRLRKMSVYAIAAQLASIPKEIPELTLHEMT